MCFSVWPGSQLSCEVNSALSFSFAFDNLLIVNVVGRSVTFQKLGEKQKFISENKAFTFGV